MGWYTAQSTYIPIVPQCMSPRPNQDLPPPLPQSSVSLPRLQRGGAHSPAVVVVGVGEGAPIPTPGEKAQHSVYSVLYRTEETSMYCYNLTRHIMYLYNVTVFNFQQESKDFLIKRLCEIISKKIKIILGSALNLSIQSNVSNPDLH